MDFQDESTEMRPILTDYNTQKNTQNNQSNLTKTKVGGLSRPTLETYYKASDEDSVVLAYG